MSKCKKPDKNSAGGKKNANSSEEKCPVKTWITVSLGPKKRSKNYKWWPKEYKSKYTMDKYEMELTSGKVNGIITFGGLKWFSGIPPGTCSLQCPDFYNRIEIWMLLTLKYPLTKEQLDILK